MDQSQRKEEKNSLLSHIWNVSSLYALRAYLSSNLFQRWYITPPPGELPNGRRCSFSRLEVYITDFSLTKGVRAATQVSSNVALEENFKNKKK